jgi:site-specific DNA-methyltransferase (adenine-specific)
MEDLLSMSNSITPNLISNVDKIIKSSIDLEINDFGEVMTPLWLVHDMMNDLPSHIWSNPYLKWLDPCSGIGTFQSIIIDKLMNGLSYWEKDEFLRYKYITEKMIYCCEIQEKNVEKYKELFSLDNQIDLNIYCGSYLDNEFNRYSKKNWGIEVFDIIIGNPPYQDHKDCALYPDFCLKSFWIGHIVSMVIPSRFFGGGKGSGIMRLREYFQKSGKIEKIKTISEEKIKIFRSKAKIRGSICYFTKSSGHNSSISNFNNRKINLSLYDIIIDDADMFDIINHILSLKLEPITSSIFRSQSYFNIPTNSKYFKDNKEDKNDLLCHVSKYKGYVKYIHKDHIHGKKDDIDKWKVITPRSSFESESGLGNSFIGKPGEVCSASYMFFAVESEDEAKSLLSYLKTSFFNLMISSRKVSQDISEKTFLWIPKIPFDRIWNEKSLYDFLNMEENHKEIVLKKAASIKYNR